MMRFSDIIQNYLGIKIEPVLTARFNRWIFGVRIALTVTFILCTILIKSVDDVHGWAVAGVLYATLDTVAYAMFSLTAIHEEIVLGIGASMKQTSAARYAIGFLTTLSTLLYFTYIIDTDTFSLPSDVAACNNGGFSNTSVPGGRGCRTQVFVTFVYLTTQTLSTVGYGDVLPTSTLSRVMLTFYHFFALLVGAVMIGMVIEGVKERSKRQKDTRGATRSLYSSAYTTSNRGIVSL